MKARYEARISIFFVLLLASNLICAAPANFTIKVGIIPASNSENSPNHDLLKSIPSELAVALNRSAQANFEASITDSLPQVPLDSEENEKLEYDYFLKIEFTDKTDHTQISAELYNNEGEKIAEFKAIPAQGRNVIRKIHSWTVLNLSKNVRIMIPNFKNLGKDHPFLQEVLPDMLEVHLKTSPRLTLLHFTSKEQLEQFKKDAEETSGLTDVMSVLKLGDLLRANYLIVGEYISINDELYIHTKGVARETGEIILVGDLYVPTINLKEIKEEVAKWAVKLRHQIEVDFLASAKRWRRIAVSGFPPDPNTPENRDILVELIRTFSKKLKTMDLVQTRIVESADLAKQQVNGESTTDLWTMSEQFESDAIITIKMDRLERDNLELTIGLFDPAQPASTEYLDTLNLAPNEFEKGIEGAIDQMLHNQWFTQTNETPRNTQSVHYRGAYKEYTKKFRIGVSKRQDPDLYLDTEAGLTLEWGVLINPWPASNWQFEPRIKFDFLGSASSGDEVVIGMDLLGTTYYRFRPHFRLNPFVGLSGGFLGVIRKSDDIGVDGKPGAGVIIGLEQTFANGESIEYAFEYTKSFGELSSKTLGGESFDGGHAGGSYLSIGWSF